MLPPSHHYIAAAHWPVLHVDEEREPEVEAEAARIESLIVPRMVLIEPRRSLFPCAALASSPSHVPLSRACDAESSAH